MRLVARDVSLFRCANWFGEKQAAPIARITDAFGDTRSPRQPRRFKRVLQEDGEIESFATHLSYKFFPAQPSLVASGIPITASPTQLGARTRIFIARPRFACAAQLR